MQISVLRIVGGTAVDGPGLRTSVYCAGCHNRCPGCHNPQSWDILKGRPTDTAELAERVLAEECDGVTFTGGDPMEQPEAFAELAHLLRARGVSSIWCYTGRLYENLLGAEETLSLLCAIDVLVDGPYVAALRDEELLFRGSSNQRAIDVPESLRQGRTVEVDLDELIDLDTLQ